MCAARRTGCHLPQGHTGGTAQTQLGTVCPVDRQHLYPEQLTQVCEKKPKHLRLKTPQQNLQAGEIAVLWFWHRRCWHSGREATPWVVWILSPAQTDAVEKGRSTKFTTDLRAA